MTTTFTLNQKTCPCCSSAVIGRTDKIFCSIKCKNIHHNAARSQLNIQIKQTQKMIQRNLVVFEGILGPEHNQMSIHKDTLFHYGFNLYSCTSISKKGKNIIYELGNYSYVVFSNGIVKVTRHNLILEKYDLFFNRWQKEFPYENKFEGSNWNNRVKLNLIGFERSIKRE